MDFKSDISNSTACAAFYGVSMNPERRGRQWVEGYAEGLQRDYDELARYANTDEKKALLDEEFQRYREGVRRRNLAYLASSARCISSFITGPSNFPVRRAEKRNGWAASKLDELLDFEKRAKAAILKKLRPELRPIMSGDADAVERLEKKIASAERGQARMKEANAAIRENAKAGELAQVAALVVLGFEERKARELLKPDFCGRLGFPAWALTNNNANIRRMKERLEQITRAKETPDATVEGEGVRLEDCPAENRVKLFFDAKPAEAVRDRLKQNGFRWAPTVGAWQAYRNLRTLKLAGEMLGAKEAA